MARKQNLIYARPLCVSNLVMPPEEHVSPSYLAHTCDICRGI